MRSLCVLLALSIFITISVTANDEMVICTVINNEIMDIKSETMPMYRNGHLYVPYTVFTGSIGLTGARNDVTSTLVLFNAEHSLTFYLLQSYVSDDKNTYYTTPAFYRGNTIYVPLQLVVSKFSLYYSYINANIPIIRLSNKKSALSDEIFISVAQININEKIDEYYNPGINTPPEITIPEDDGTTNMPNEQPPEITPPDTTEEKEDKYAKPEYVKITFDAIDTSTDILLGLLQDNSTKATFFSTSDEIIEFSDIARKIVGLGHSIGILVDDKNIKGDALISYVEAEGEMFKNILGIKPRIVRVVGEKFNYDSFNSLIQHGYKLWHYDFTVDQAMSHNIYKRISTNKGVCLKIQIDKNTAKTLYNVLLQTTKENINSQKISFSDNPGDLL